MKKVIFLYILIHTQFMYGGDYSQECVVPWSPGTKTAVKIEKSGKAVGNCYVWGDLGQYTCHMPGDKGRSTKFLKNNTQFDSLFLQNQKNTGVSWKLIKSIVYQETSLSKKGLALKSFDGLGQGFMQLSFRETDTQIKWMKKNAPWAGSFQNMTYQSVFSNPVHHLALGTSWLFSKANTYSKGNKGKELLDEAYKYKDTPNGWYPNKEFEAPFEIAVSAFNGLSKGCRINGRMITRYGELVLSYYHFLDTGVSSLPVPYVGSPENNSSIDVPNSNNDNPNVQSKGVKIDSQSFDPFQPWKF